jgi:hypothetical protein
MSLSASKGKENKTESKAGAMKLFDEIAEEASSDGSGVVGASGPR